jgi:hypothetical protein
MLIIGSMRISRLYNASENDEAESPTAGSSDKATTMDVVGLVVLNP